MLVIFFLPKCFVVCETFRNFAAELINSNGNQIYA